jgi:hypothetical protein
MKDGATKVEKLLRNGTGLKLNALSLNSIKDCGRKS